MRLGFCHRRKSRYASDEHICEMLEKILCKLEEDDEPDYDELDPHMEAVLESAIETCKNPPATWRSYLLNKDYEGIVRMEGNELMTALAAHDSIHAVRKELVHVIAAMMKALKH